MSRFATPSKIRGKSAPTFDIASQPSKPKQKEPLHRYGKGTAVVGPSLKGSHEFDGIVVDGLKSPTKLMSAEKLNNSYYYAGPTTKRPDISAKVDRTVRSKSPLSTSSNNSRSATPNRTFLEISTKNLNNFNSSNQSISTFSSRPRSASSVSSRSYTSGVTPINRLNQLKQANSFVIDNIHAVNSFHSQQQLQSGFTPSKFTSPQMNSSQQQYSSPSAHLNNSFHVGGGGGSISGGGRSISPHSLTRSQSNTYTGAQIHYTGQSPHTIHNIELSQSSYRSVRKGLRRESLEDFLLHTTVPNNNSYVSGNYISSPANKRVANLQTLTSQMRNNILAELQEYADKSRDEIFFPTENYKSVVVSENRCQLHDILHDYLLSMNHTAEKLTEAEQRNFGENKVTIDTLEQKLSETVDTKAQKLKQNTALKKQLAQLITTVDAMQQNGLHLHRTLLSLLNNNKAAVGQIFEELDAPSLLTLYVNEEEADSSPSNHPTPRERANSNTSALSGCSGADEDGGPPVEAPDARSLEDRRYAVDFDIINQLAGHSIESLHSSEHRPLASTTPAKSSHNSANSTPLVSTIAVAPASSSSAHSVGNSSTTSKAHSVRELYAKIRNKSVSPGKNRSTGATPTSTSTNNANNANNSGTAGDLIDLHALAYGLPTTSPANTFHKVHATTSTTNTPSRTPPPVIRNHTTSSPNNNNSATGGNSGASTTTPSKLTLLQQFRSRQMGSTSPGRINNNNNSYNSTGGGNQHSSVYAHTISSQLPKHEAPRSYASSLKDRNRAASPAFNKRVEVIATSSPSHNSSSPYSTSRGVDIMAKVDYKLLNEIDSYSVSSSHNSRASGTGYRSPPKVPMPPTSSYHANPNPSVPSAGSGASGYVGITGRGSAGGTVTYF